MEIHELGGFPVIMGAESALTSLLHGPWLDNLSTLHQLQFRARLTDQQATALCGVSLRTWRRWNNVICPEWVRPDLGIGSYRCLDGDYRLTVETDAGSVDYDLTVGGVGEENLILEFIRHVLITIHGAKGFEIIVMFYPAPK